MKPLSGGLTCRRLVATSAWSVPLAVVAGPAPGGFGEQPANRVATVTTDAGGEARVKACAATYSSEAPIVT